MKRSTVFWNLCENSWSGLGLTGSRKIGYFSIHATSLIGSYMWKTRTCLLILYQPLTIRRYLHFRLNSSSTNGSQVTNPRKSTKIASIWNFKENYMLSFKTKGVVL